MSALTFLEDFATTLGPIQAYPAGWSRQEVLEIGQHESRHTTQARWLGLGSPWLGILPMALAYILPFPIGFAWCRYRLELDAEVHLWTYLLRQGMPEENIRQRATSSAKMISSSSYGWAMPQFWALSGYDKKVEEVLSIERQRRARLV